MPDICEIPKTTIDTPIEDKKETEILQVEDWDQAFNPSKIIYPNYSKIR